MCLRFIDGDEGRISDQVVAIDYAVKMGAKVSNNSYGGYGFSKPEFEAIDRARSQGHLFVASAGNDNIDTDLPKNDHTPSIYALDNILAIGASTEDGRKAQFSNYGATTVDVFAPGDRIRTLVEGAGYKTVSGTSFAAPMGAGAAALIWSRYPMLSHQEVKASLVRNCKKSLHLTRLGVCGGVVDIPKSLYQAGLVAAGSIKGGANPRKSVPVRPASKSVPYVAASSARELPSKDSPAGGSLNQVASYSGDSFTMGLPGNFQLAPFMFAGPSFGAPATGWLSQLFDSVLLGVRDTPYSNSVEHAPPSTTEVEAVLQQLGLTAGEWNRLVEQQILAGGPSLPALVVV
eukprot:Polyplicarium_translucidae@DN1960_c0_g1_i1.p1